MSSAPVMGRRLSPSEAQRKKADEAVARRRQELESVFAMMAPKDDTEHGEAEHISRQENINHPLFRSRERNVSRFTQGGRPIVLSARSRRLPPVFTEQKRTMRDIAATMSSVGTSLKDMNIAYSRVTESGLPPETLHAVQESHRRFTQALKSGELNKQQDGRPRSYQQSAGHSAVLGLSMQSESVEDSFAGDEGRSVPLEELSRKAWLTLVARARVAANDEGTMDDQSEDDYAEDPMVPRIVADATIRMELDEVQSSIPKLRENANMLLQLQDDKETQWWSSALRTRDVKTNAVRMNYHARRAMVWDWRAQEQLLLQAAYLNNRSQANRNDLIKLQGHLVEFAQRIEKCVSSTAAINDAVTQLQEELVKVNTRRIDIQAEIVRQAQEEFGLLHFTKDDALSSELLLLLSNENMWPLKLREDVAKVKEWIRAERPSLE